MCLLRSFSRCCGVFLNGFISGGFRIFFFVFSLFFVFLMGVFLLFARGAAGLSLFITRTRSSSLFLGCETHLHTPRARFGKYFKYHLPIVKKQNMPAASDLSSRHWAVSLLSGCSGCGLSGLDGYQVHRAARLRAEGHIL